jgi:hypothetical protein
MYQSTVFSGNSGKNSQMEMMRVLYTKAQQVLVWLGEEGGEEALRRRSLTFIESEV